jgi:hypothetical protein
VYFLISKNNNKNLDLEKNKLLKFLPQKIKNRINWLNKIKNTNTNTNTNTELTKFYIKLY